MITCKNPIVRGPNKGQPATGTYAGYVRHVKADEVPCDDCYRAKLERNKEQGRRLRAEQNTVTVRIPIRVLEQAILEELT